MDEDLRGERRTATAGARRVGVFDHELRTLEAFGVIDLGADEILVAHRVDDQHHPVFLHLRVVVALYFVERKTVLRPLAAATRDKHAQLQFGVAFLVDQLLDFVGGAVSENKRRGHLCDSIHVSTPVANPIIGPGPEAVNRASHVDGAAGTGIQAGRSHCRPLDRGLARRELQLHGLGFARAVYQMPLDYGAEMHLQAVVMHISFDPGTRLEFEEFGYIHGPCDLAVYDQVRYADFPFDAGLFSQHQGRRLVGNRGYVSDDFAVDTKASGEIDITLDLRADTNQAVDAILRLARLLAKHSASYLLRKVDVLAGTGLAGPVLQDTRLYRPHPGSRRNPKCSLNSTKIFEVEPKSSAARLG